VSVSRVSPERMSAVSNIPFTLLLYYARSFKPSRNQAWNGAFCLSWIVQLCELMLCWSRFRFHLSESASWPRGSHGVRSKTNILSNKSNSRTPRVLGSRVG
jgi:hypothetical protein